MNPIIYKSKENVLELLKYRHFKISSKKSDEFLKSNVNTIEVSNTQEMDIFTYCVNVPRVNQKILTKLIEDNYRQTDKSITLSIITIDSITPSITNSIKTFEKKYGLDIVFYQLKNLMVNPTKHSMYSKHIRMKTDENFKKDLCDSLHICDIERIPKISKDDVIARYINLKIGEIVRIEKRTENSGICNVFKLCV